MGNDISIFVISMKLKYLNGKFTINDSEYYRHSENLRRSPWYWSFLELKYDIIMKYKYFTKIDVDNSESIKCREMSLINTNVN